MIFRKKKSILIFLLGHLIFIIVLLAFIIPLYFVGLKDEHFLLFVIVISLVLLPLLDHFYYRVKTIDGSNNLTDIDLETIDSILGMKSLDDFLEDRFNNILEMLSVRNGMLIFYNREKENYKIYQHFGDDKKIYYDTIIDNSSILLKIINSADDIIVKRKLNLNLNFEKKIYDELSKLNAEIIIPMYYQNIFMGIMVFGDRKLKFKNDEVQALKILASKIAILSINSYFLNENLKKKELEKEHELGKKVQMKFLPNTELKYKNIKVLLYFKSSYLVGEKIYDVFQHNDEVRVTAYGVSNIENNPIILLPAVKALLQAYTRLGFEVQKSVSHMKSTVRDRGIIDEDLDIVHISVKTNGEAKYYSKNYPAPYIFYNGQLSKVKSTIQNNVMLKPGALMIFCSNKVNEKIKSHFHNFELFLKKQKKGQLNIIKEYLLELLNSNNDDYVFFSIISMENYSE